MSPSDAQLPADLANIANHPRVLLRRSGAPRKGGKCIVYWMQRALRVLDNPALDTAIDAANVLRIPVVIYFQVIPNYPNATYGIITSFSRACATLPKTQPSAASDSLCGVHPRSSKSFSNKSSAPCSSATRIRAANLSAGVECWPAA